MSSPALPGTPENNIKGAFTTNPDVKRAYLALREKQLDCKLRWDYYDGLQPLVYTASKLKDIFPNLDARFTQNWCSVVIRAYMDRIQLKGFSTSDGVSDSLLTQIFDELEMAQLIEEVVESLLVTGESFIIAWPDPEAEARGEIGVNFSHNEARLAVAFYRPDRPTQMEFAAKWWEDPISHRIRMNLYYPDRVEYYISQGEARTMTESSRFVVFEPPADHDFGRIPVFHFRISNRKRRGLIDDIIPLQNGINKLLTDMLVAAEYGAFRQRWVITNSDVSGLENAPGRVWEIPASVDGDQATSVGEFSETNLSNYLNAIDKLINSIGVIAKLPKFYYQTQVGDPSGEALIAMESPMVKEAERHINRMKATLRGLMSFATRMLGSEIPPSEINPEFDDPSTVQPKTEVEIDQLEVGMGVPLITVKRRRGWSPDELAQLEKDLAKAEELKQAAMAAYLSRMQENMDRLDSVKPEEDTEGE